ncbi:MAG: STAS domain-containing protein, partial [Deltaproteobacteria bacterium]|nr:STAS domain-containing protein [Deltaproteobacteria bacterium]
MSRTPIEIDVRPLDPSAVALDLSGNLYSDIEGLFIDRIAPLDPAVRTIITNFQSVEGIGILGIHALTVLAARLDQQGRRLAAVGLSAPQRQIFRLTRLDEAISPFDDEKGALAARGFRKNQRTSSPEAGVGGKPAPGWTLPVAGLWVEDLPGRAVNLNVQGQETTGPVRGFGRLWDKSYRLRLNRPDLAPAEVIRVWRSNFPVFWPEGNHVYTSKGAAVEPGTAALLNLKMPGGLVLATGILVIYADETSFSFITARGHILSAWIIFSAFRDDGSGTVAQVRALLRAADPLAEAGFRLGAGAQEDRFWEHTLQALAGRFQAPAGTVEQEDLLIDPRVRWKEFG